MLSDKVVKGLHRAEITKLIRRIIIMAGWLIIWQLASALTGLELLLAGPVSVFIRLVDMLGDYAFYKIIIRSTFNIISGLSVALLAGCILGIIAAKVRLAGEILYCPVVVMRSLPVASFIILLLIWCGSKKIAFYIAFIVAFPMIYSTVRSGMERTDEGLLKMAEVFKVPMLRRLRCIYAGYVLDGLEEDVGVTIGICFKAGVSAEVIGLSVNSIGEQLYYSKLYLMTADLFAWSLVVVILSFVLEHIGVMLIKAVKKIMIKC